MRIFVDLTGKRFGRLVVIGLSGKNKSGNSLWLCKCNCGNEKIIVGFHLTRKNRSTKSCGCLQKELTSKLGKSRKTHGHTKGGNPSRTYVSWSEMIKRCANPKVKYYSNYGGRQIKVCSRWSNKNPKGFQNFLNDMGERPKGKSLDKINNNKNYCAKNCKWSTHKEQVRNQRSNRLETFNDKTQCRSAWAEEYNILYQTLRSRLDRGMSIEEALTKPVRSRHTK